MKDITIFENFINDEELEEARQFIGEESLNINGKIYDESNPLMNRQWCFVSVDNCYKKNLIDLRPPEVRVPAFPPSDCLVRSIGHHPFDMEHIIPSVKNFILKMKNRIDKCTNTKFKIERVYLNRQMCGQDVTLHTDDFLVSSYTLLIYIGDITPENYDKAGGDLELKTTEITRIEPFTKRAVLFKGYIPHQAYAPLVPDLTRISFAFKFVDTSNELPFAVHYT